MPKRRFTKLFWCGVFVIAFSVYLIGSNVFGAIVMYSVYSSFLAHQSQAMTNFMSTYMIVLLRDLAFLAVQVALLAVGVYVLKQGIKVEDAELPATPAQTAPV